MRYIPQTYKEREEHLKSVGIASSQSLFDCIPSELRLTQLPDMTPAMAEGEITGFMTALAAKNRTAADNPTFLGAGVYDHYVPSAVGHIISRQEFITAYTPYQPEISQGTLTAIFEYQTMLCNLTGLQVSNASMYDAASAAAEAMLLCAGNTRRDKILISSGMSPETIETVKTYARFSDIEVIDAPLDKRGKTLLDGLDDTFAAVFVQSPNFFGVIEDMESIAAVAHGKGAMAVAAVDPLSLALLKPPGECGFDIAVGDIQPFGLQMNFGGPHCGFIVATEKLMRKLPGRIVGETTDKDGKRAFVLTLQAREQHIRREKATSNICSNHSLNALAGVIYLSLVGPEGLRECATQSATKARYLHDILVKSGKFTPVYNSPFFREFALKCDAAPQKLNEAARSAGFIGGLDLGQRYPDMQNCLLLAVTEKRTLKEIDAFAERMVAV